jgi:hypothetical protein
MFLLSKFQKHVFKILGLGLGNFSILPLFLQGGSYIFMLAPPFLIANITVWAKKELQQ